MTQPDGLASHTAFSNEFFRATRQRLSITRALAKKAAVYIFDDSFSALDAKTDAALRHALKDATKDAAVIIIAQRVSTILHADQILVLDDGKIAGLGTHSWLLSTVRYIRILCVPSLGRLILSYFNGGSLIL